MFPAESVLTMGLQRVGTQTDPEASVHLSSHTRLQMVESNVHSPCTVWGKGKDTD